MKKVIGIGNVFRQDDGVGPFVIQRLKERGGFAGVELIQDSGESFRLLEAWKDASLVILVDAVLSGRSSGDIVRLDVGVDPIPKELFPCSTHAFSLAETIELARSLDQLPAKMIVYGIEGKNFEPGEGLSSEVETVVENVIELILEDV